MSEADVQLFQTWAEQLAIAEDRSTSDVSEPRPRALDLCRVGTLSSKNRVHAE
jgi:hypothetical protein